MEDNGEGKGAEWTVNMFACILTPWSHVWKCIETVHSGKAVILIRYLYIHIYYIRYSYAHTRYAYVIRTLAYDTHTLLIRLHTLRIRW